MKKFDRTEIMHVPREQNMQADILSKLKSTKKKGGKKSVIQESISPPSIEKSTMPPEVCHWGKLMLDDPDVQLSDKGGASLGPKRGNRDQMTSMFVRGNRT